MALVDMETDSSSFPSSSSSAAARWNYDVFLSFRGEDTRYNFVGHLYEALIQKGIHTFKDDKNLDRGKPISPELLKAIEESRFAIVIISKDYASSAWCLDELAHIIHCKKEMEMTILPVFHYVEPSDIRKQMGTFEQAFIKHEEKENKERVEKWRDALRQVGNLAGCHLKNDRYETEHIKDIMGWISLHLKYDAFPYITRDLVGIYSRMVELESFLAIGSNDVRIIGVWGMGGMGKTTLARVVYHMVSKEFEAYSFIEDVRENSEKHGLVGLQHKLISNILEETDLKIRDKYDGVLKIRNRLCHRRILLVLDDVNKLDQLKMLAGEHDWFGLGSRIIITTRDVHVLKTHGVDEIYEVQGLYDKDAFQLFCSKAFKKDHVPNEYLVMFEEFLKYAAGLPLALEVLGSFLFEKDTNEWKSALKRLKEYPNTEILDVLKISFDVLQKLEQEIFLHIACFFNHKKKDHAVDILDSLGLYAVIGLKELINKSLLKIDNGDRLWMHDLLEEMGKNIVRQECSNDCGKRSRLWRNEDIDNMLKKNKGNEVVQAMNILCRNIELKEVCWSPEAISQMYNLKFLKIDGGFFHDTPHFNWLGLPNSLPSTFHLPNSLRVLDWWGYPSNSLPSTFQLDELVMLCLPQSRIEKLWIGIKNFDKLKIINLSGPHLIISPDFTGVPNLEKLNLANCQNLHVLHPSVGILKELVLLYLDFTSIMELPSSIGGLICLTSLTLKGCKKLVCLPNTICCLKSLECLRLSGCSNFENLPENLGNVKGLKELDLSGTAIKELPSSIERLMHLTSLTLFNCHKLVSLPNTTCGFRFRGALDLSICSRFKNLPENPWIIEGLKMLDLSKTVIKEMPSSIERLTSLTSLTLRHCEYLQCLPSAICSLKSLESLDLFGCSNLYNLPENLGNVKSLQKLDLRRTTIKELPSSIERLTRLTLLALQGCKNLENLPENLGNVKGLEMLDLSKTDIKEMPSSIERLTSLTSLTLRRCEYLQCLPSAICSLKSLESLDLFGCSNLYNLPENLGNVKSLQKLDLRRTTIKELPSSIERLTRLTLLALQGCKNLENLPENLGNIKGLKELDLSGTAIKELLSSIEHLTSLTSLTLRCCEYLQCLPSAICSLKSLESLDLFGCSNLYNLPENLGNVKSLQKLDLSRTTIKELPSSIERLTSLTSLTLKGCKYLGCSNLYNLLENLGNVKSLQKLDLSGTAIKELPSSIERLTMLTLLALQGCKNLENLPENLGNVKGLKELDLSRTTIKEFPSSIERLMHLTSLTLFNCHKLVSLPNTTCGFKFRGALDLSTCPRFKNLPENPWIIEGLEMLDLSKTAIEGMPSSIGRLTNLTALALRFCMNLVHLPSIICSLKLLNFLDLFGCLKLEILPENIGNMKGLEELNLCWTSIKEVPSSIVLLKNLKKLYIRRWKLSEFYSQPASLESMDPLWNLSHSQPTSPLECIGLPSFLYYSLPASPVLEGLLFSSLSGLHSLTYLHINDCDLLLIPNDIGCLSSLECLNLSGNNFVFLPESMSQLSNLRSLYLEGCKRLQSLGNVPSTIDSVIANNCSSLERLPELQFYPFRSNYSRFQCFNCFKLVDYIQNGSNMLQGLPNIVIPGGEIPKWFSHERRGDSMQLPFRGFDELIGIALCVVFVPNGSRQYHIYQNFKCNFWLNGLYIADFAQSYYFRTEFGRVESPHIWLLYLPTHHFISNRGKIHSLIDAYGFSQLEIKIYVEVVEKIGVRLVYKQDMEDPNQTMAQCINNNTLYEDLGVLRHDIDNSAVESSRNRQSRDVDDGAGPSGEGYFNGESQPKWIQREIFDFFSREDEMPKNLESIHGGKEDIYQDIKGPNQTMTQLSINSRMLYEDLGDLHHDLYNSAAKGNRNKRSRAEEDGAGPSGEGCSNKEPELKRIH
nr:protein SUPPRESSOR OF npr1-1, CONSTITUTIVE 1-like [Quercus suber]